MEQELKQRIVDLEQTIEAQRKHISDLRSIARTLEERVNKPKIK